MVQSGNESIREQWGMRLMALALAAGSVGVLAQTPIPMIKEDAPPARPQPQLKGVSAETVAVPDSALRGLAESEPDISARDEAPQPGTVLLKVLVSKTGAMEEAVVVRGEGELPRVAVAGVMGWSYRPYLVNGEPREIQSTILLQFRDGVGRRAPVTVALGMAGMGGVAGMSGMGSATQGQRFAVLPGTVRVSSGTMAGLMLDRPAPVYPPIAKAAHVQGVVILHAVISKTGEIEDLQVISGPPMLTGAAVDAVKKWTYRPYLLNGVPVEVDTTINVNFQIAEPPKPPDAAGDAESGQDPPVRVSAGTMAGLALERPTPVCAAPVEPHASGTVILHAIISKQGTVKDVQVVSAAKSLQECSLAAVRQWRYMPYLVDGVPKEVETTIMIDMLFGGKASQEDTK